MKEVKPYKPKNKVRIVTAASLFDGHDAAINIMRRIIQSSGCEVIHLGHDRSVKEIVDCAIEEDANAIALTSYQGGHNEFLKYMYDLLKENSSEHIKIFAGGGGTILPEEIKELEDYGITKIYHPDDKLISEIKDIENQKIKSISRAISAVENFPNNHKEFIKTITQKAKNKEVPILGITGTGGAGKSSLVDELVRRFLNQYENIKIGIISVDPSKRKTGGALLGDRIRMNSINSNRVYMRSLATRQANLALSKHVSKALEILKVANFDLIILETSGIGQSDTEITEHSSLSAYVMTPEYGAATQLEKIDMLDFADIIAINKFDKKGSFDAVKDVKKQYQRNNKLFTDKVDNMPVYGTIASQFNDPGTNTFFYELNSILLKKGFGKFELKSLSRSKSESEKIYVIPPKRVRYLSEIADSNRDYDKWVNDQSEIAKKLYALKTSMELFQKDSEAYFIHYQTLRFQKLLFLNLKVGVIY